MLIIQFFFLHGLCSFNKSKSCYANKLYGIGFPNIGLLKSVLLGKKNVLIRDGGKKEKSGTERLHIGQMQACSLSVPFSPLQWNLGISNQKNMY